MTEGNLFHCACCSIRSAVCLAVHCTVKATTMDSGEEEMDLVMLMAISSKLSNTCLNDHKFSL